MRVGELVAGEAGAERDGRDLIDHGELAKVQLQPGLLRELALRAQNAEPSLHLARTAGTDDSTRVKHQDARPRRRKGKLDCGESPGRIVRIRAAARDEVEVERQRQARVGTRHGFRKRDHLPAARGGGRAARSDSKSAHVNEPRRQAQDLRKGREWNTIREPGGLDDFLVRQVFGLFGGLLEDALFAASTRYLFDGLDQLGARVCAPGARNALRKGHVLP